MNLFIRYVKHCVKANVKFENVRSLSAHWLHGTDPITLAYLSHQGTVYNPPGH